MEDGLPVDQIAGRQSIVVAREKVTQGRGALPFPFVFDGLEIIVGHAIYELLHFFNRDRSGWLPENVFFPP